MTSLIVFGGIALLVIAVGAYSLHGMDKETTTFGKR